MTLIKKYKNRKFYDTSRGIYVNLSSIEEMLDNKESVLIIKDDKDITVDVIAKIIGNKLRQLTEHKIKKFYKEVQNEL